MARVNTVVAAAAIAGLWTCALAQERAPATAPIATKATAPDVTAKYRNPGALVAKCGAATVQDLGVWPDMQTAFEHGEVLEIVNLPLGGAINARGQAIVPLAESPKDGFFRPDADGLVQYVIKSRPSAGRVNSRGDVIGALYVDNSDAGGAPVIQRTFVAQSSAGAPIAVDVPAGMRLDATGLNDAGVGIGNLFPSIVDPALPPQGPFYIEVDKTKNAATLRPVIDRAKLPAGLLTTTAASINNKGEVLLNLQRDTGERSRGGAFDKDGKLQLLCHGPIGTAEQCAIVRGDALEIVPLPDGAVSMCGYVLLDDGTIIARNQRKGVDEGQEVGVIWRAGRITELQSFAPTFGARPSDADGSLVCGQAIISDTAMGKPPKEVDPAVRELFYSLRACGVLWNSQSGTMLTLDSLLPPDSPCTHITEAGAIRGNKVLCRGLIGGKEHGVIVTLPANVDKGFTQAN